MSSFASTQSLDQTSAEMKEMQARALDEILGVLLSAGYFRARVGALTPFDKVVGGLCWCITSSGTAVDVDIFYDEDLALGAKIQLSENIIKVLRGIGCPAPLQAHQIQGGDFAAIFPVIRWLVTKVLEYRRITGDYVRMASETAFDQNYAPFAPSSMGATSSLAMLTAVLKAASSSSTSSTALSSSTTTTTPSATAAIAVTAAALKNDAEKAGDAFLAEVNGRYKPVRKYRRAAGTWRAGGSALSPEARVQSCLLEFGERTVVKATTQAGDEEAAAEAAAAKTAARSGNDFERKFAAKQRAARAEEEEKRRAAVALEASMMTQMTEAKGGAVSGQNVGALVNLQAEELRRAAADYKAKEEELRALAESGDLLANTKHGRAAAHSRRVGGLQKRKEAAEEAVAEQTSALAAVEAELNEARESLLKADKFNTRAVTEIAKLDAQVAALPPQEQAKFRSLVEAHTRVEGLKLQEAAFKLSCKEQRASLKAMLLALQEDNANGPTAARLAQLEATHADMRARFDRARATLAARAREVARLSRALDEVPSRTELVQYERRFLELFDEVAERLDETRKYFVLYNMLEKKKTFLSKEESLITSVLDNFAPSMKTTKTQKAYIEQVDGTVRSIEEALAKQQAQADSKKAARDGRAAELQKLVDAQRAYYRSVKEMQDAAEMNDRLQAALAARSGGS